MEKSVEDAEGAISAEGAVLAKMGGARRCTFAPGSGAVGLVAGHQLQLLLQRLLRQLRRRLRVQAEQIPLLALVALLAHVPAVALVRQREHRAEPRLVAVLV